MQNCHKWVLQAGKTSWQVPTASLGVGRVRQHCPTSPARSSWGKLEEAIFPGVSDGKQELPGFWGKPGLGDRVRKAGRDRLVVPGAFCNAGVPNPHQSPTSPPFLWRKKTPNNKILFFFLTPNICPPCSRLDSASPALLQPAMPAEPRGEPWPFSYPRDSCPGAISQVTGHCSCLALENQPRQH